MVLFMTSRGWLRWGHALAAGIAVGTLVTALFGWGQRPLYGSALGGTFGLIFWWVAIFRDAGYPTVPKKIPWMSFAALLALWLLAFFLYFPYPLSRR
jgi:hypothetical protein